MSSNAAEDGVLPVGASAVSRMFLLGALAAVAVVVYSWFFAAEASDLVWPLSISGVVAVVILAYAAFMTRKGRISRLASLSYLVTISIVNFIFLGWYAGGMVARSHGNQAGAELLVERLMFIAIFAAIVIVPYRRLYRLRLDAIDREKSPPAN